MSGVYGDLLYAFPEAFQTVKYFEKEPRIGAGFNTISDGYTDVIIQPEKQFTLMIGTNTSSGANNILSEKDKEYIWAPEDTPLHVGIFIMDEEDGRLCAITGKADWKRYGGFIRFDFDIVQGATGDTDRPVATVKKGKF